MNRGSGILLPVFSLPSNYGIGTFGNESYKFIDFLKNSKQKYWQMLPLNPTSYGDSPYQSFSAFALNPYFIDLDMLIEDELLSKKDVEVLNNSYQRKIDYGNIYHLRFNILRKAFINAGNRYSKQIQKFRKDNESWLEDYAMFMVIKGLHDGQSWTLWKDEYRLRDYSTLVKLQKDHQEDINFWIFMQYCAYTQYSKLKAYAKKNDIQIIGDIPIYVAMDSADVWANFSMFQLNENRFPTVVAGVPPDYFSKTGQLWGNPIYDWEKMKKDNFSWWRDRVSCCLKLYDVLRIDHFRGMEAYWAVPYLEETAINGTWVKGPGMGLVNAIKEAGKNLSIIAEDLGFLTDDVIKLKEEAKWPGLVIYEFGYSLDDPEYKNAYLPENYKEDCVAYLGTHDNDTLAHFFLDEQNKELIPLIYKNLKADSIEQAEDTMIERLATSKAEVVIYTIQDLLKEGVNYRINTPGVAAGNWQYRLPYNYQKMGLIERLSDLVKISKR